MTALSYIFTIFKLIIIMLVVGLAGLLMLTVLPIRGDIQVLTVLSGSMEPAVGTGSVVVIRQAPSYVANDVITFGREGRQELVTHRISAVNYVGGDKTFVTKGDANNNLDPGVVSRDDIKGKVWFSVPYLGYVQNWMKTPTGFVVTIVLPGAILIYGEMMTIKNELLKKLRKRKSRQTPALAVVVMLGLMVWSWSTVGTQAILTDVEVVENNRIGMWAEDNIENQQENNNEDFLPMIESMIDGPEIEEMAENQDVETELNDEVEEENPEVEDVEDENQLEGDVVSENGDEA